MRPDLTGLVFKEWTVIRKTTRKYHYVCRCSCGAEHEVYEFDLESGKSTKCARCNSHTHGHRTMGRQSPTYNTWMCMRRRCSEPGFKDYARYGGSGIRVCDRWVSFELFLEDMGERPDGKIIDRINVLGDYEPSNCRWVTPKESAANRRMPGTVVLP